MTGQPSTLSLSLSLALSPPLFLCTFTLSQSLVFFQEVLGAVGLGPQHLATLRLESSRVLLVDEFLQGGSLSVEDLSSDVLLNVGARDGIQQD